MSVFLKKGYYYATARYVENTQGVLGSPEGVFFVPYEYKEEELVENQKIPVTVPIKVEYTINNRQIDYNIEYMHTRGTLIYNMVIVDIFMEHLVYLGLKEPDEEVIEALYE